MIPGIDPKVDYAFKKVFGSEANVALLRSLLEAVLNPPPDQAIDALEICNPFNDKENLDDKLSILDIRVRDRRGQQYNVEMQMAGSRVYPQRVLYYWSLLHSQQLREGDDYKKLQATISISFLDGVLFAQVPDYHQEFRLRGTQHPQIEFSPHLAIHLVELPKFRLSADELTNTLEQWTYFLNHGSELDADNLPASLREGPVRQAMEVLTMMTKSDLERERYQARVKAERDQRAILLEAEEARAEIAAARTQIAAARTQIAAARAEATGARAEGLAEGRTEGRNEGVAKGETIGRIHVCQRLLKSPLSPTDELLAQSTENLEQIAAALEQKLGLVP
ncbi:MAG: PD-(D/E)XK nuclease family transposase [Planctomycetes bacterium]|nr:PD-(D/E)XK nuclease family transposase [Planctomycetota bacterium]